MSSDSAHPQPLVFEQSRLGFVDMDAVDLPRTNADGEPVVEPTPEQQTETFGADDFLFA